MRQGKAPTSKSSMEDFCHPSTCPLPERVKKFELLVQELIDYRLAAYEFRRASTELPANVIPINRNATVPKGVELPYFPNLKIACGHFKTATVDAEVPHTGYRLR